MINSKNRKILVGVLIVVAASLGLGGWYAGSHARHMVPPVKSANNGRAEQYTPLSITLRDGKLVGPASTYVVKQGTGLEFDITSNVFGKIQVPTRPVQTIAFTQSPVIFRLTASRPGSYPLKYLADGSKNIIVIGTIVVRSGN